MTTLIVALVSSVLTGVAAFAAGVLVGIYLDTVDEVKHQDDD